MENPATIGKRIAMLRKEKGMTQEQLAERVGVSPQAVSKWENDISCPDISLLPQLAEILGTTTDELLGARPIEPHVVVVESENKNKANAKKGYHFQWNGGSASMIFSGCLLLLIGIALLLNKLGLWPLAGEITFWGIVWPAALLGLGIAWMLERFSLFNLAVTGVGFYCLLYNLGCVTYQLTWDVIWPAALILIGLSILLKNIFPDKKRKKKPEAIIFSDEHEPEMDYSDANGYIRYSCSFTESEEVAKVDPFIGGEVDITFGKITLDLSKCRTFMEGAKLKVDVSFGSAVILLPPTVKLQQNIDRAFGSTTVEGACSEDARYTLYVKGDASFGSLTFRYV